MSSEIIIEVKNLKKYFPVRNVLGKTTALVKAVDDVSLKIKSGKTFGIVGESGCGKTTFMRSLLRLIESTSGSITLSDEINQENSVDDQTQSQESDTEIEPPEETS